MQKRARLLGWTAAGLTAVWFLVHTLVGGAEVAGPLRTSDLPIQVMAPAWMVWHMVTLILAVTAGLFALGTWRADRSLLGAATAISAAMALAGLGAAPLTGAGFGLLPQGFLFVLSGAAGALAWASSR